MTAAPPPPAPRRHGGNQQIPRPEHWTEDLAPPWERVESWSVGRLVEPIAERSAPRLPTFADARHSAVLIVLAEGERGAEVLLTRRSMSLRNHRGEISFPGGRMDPGETPVETALREAHEEVGLDPTLPTIVGELAHLSTVVSRSYIVPIVSVLSEPLELHPATGEVDRVLWTPIGDLTREGTYHLERWGTPPLDRPLHFFDLDDETVWGATAHMLVELLTATTSRQA